MCFRYNGISDERDLNMSMKRFDRFDWYTNAYVSPNKHVFFKIKMDKKLYVCGT
jgi:hypothetical protein